MRLFYPLIEQSQILIFCADSKFILNFIKYKILKLRFTNQPKLFKSLIENAFEWLSNQVLAWLCWKASCSSVTPNPGLKVIQIGYESNVLRKFWLPWQNMTKFFISMKITLNMYSEQRIKIWDCSLSLIKQSQILIRCSEYKFSVNFIEIYICCQAVMFIYEVLVYICRWISI